MLPRPHRDRTPVLLADVVHRLPPVTAMHPQPTDAATEERPEHVGALAEYAVGACGPASVVPRHSSQRGLIEDLSRHQSLVSRLLRPHPCLRWVHCPPAFAGSTVPDLVSG